MAQNINIIVQSSFIRSNLRVYYIEYSEYKNQIPIYTNVRNIVNATQFSRKTTKNMRNSHSIILLLSMWWWWWWLPLLFVGNTMWLICEAWRVEGGTHTHTVEKIIKRIHHIYQKFIYKCLVHEFVGFRRPIDTISYIYIYIEINHLLK